MLDMSNHHRMVELAEADCVNKKAEGFLMDRDQGIILIRGVETDQRKSRSKFDPPSTGASGSRKCLQQRRLQQTVLLDRRPHDAAKATRAAATGWVAAHSGTIRNKGREHESTGRSIYSISCEVTLMGIQPADPALSMG